jgi:uncharacterized membrane protein
MSTYPSTPVRLERLEHVMPPGAASPFNWLRAGLRDLLANPVLSITIGLGFTVVCAIALAAFRTLPAFSVTILTFLLFVSPFIAAAAYFVPLRRERGEEPVMRTTLEGVRSRGLSIALYSLLGALVVAAWVRIASISFALYYGSLPANTVDLARAWTSGYESPALLAFLVVATLMLATVLFALSALTLPMIVDRNCNVVTAVSTNLRILRENMLTVFVWMAVLAGLISTALLSGLVLMPLVFPLLAYATWHSYRQLSASHNTERT